MPDLAVGAAAAPPEPASDRAPGPAPAARALLVALFLAYAAWIASAREVDFDFWYHMTEGKRIVEMHRFTYADTFSHTAAGHPYPPTEWLFQVMIFGFYATLGAAGIVLYKTLFVTAWGALIVAGAQRRGARADTAVAVGALALLAAVNRFMARPEWITFVGFTAVAAHIADEEEGRAGPWRRALLIIGCLLWANAHPGIFFGVGLLWMWTVARALAAVRTATRASASAGSEAMSGSGATPGSGPGRDAPARQGSSPRGAPSYRTPALLTLAATAAAFATPAGFGSLTFFLHHADVFRRLGVEEFQPLPFTAALAPIWIYIGLAMVVYMACRRGHTLFRRLTIPLVLVLGLRNARLVPLFIGLTAPLVPAWLERVVPPLAARRSLATGVAVAVLAACIGYRVAETPRWGPIAFSIDSQQVPQGAADFLVANDIRDPLYNFQGYGSYLVWRGLRVSSDARLPLFADVFTQFRAKPFETMNRMGVNAAVVPSPESANAAFDPLAVGLLKRREVWAPVFHDGVAMVFLRRGVGHDEVIAAHELPAR